MSGVSIAGSVGVMLDTGDAVRLAVMVIVGVLLDVAVGVGVTDGDGVAVRLGVNDGVYVGVGTVKRLPCLCAV